MKIAYFGHSSFMVETARKFLVFDPYISPNPKASRVNIDKIKPNYILLSHGHEDHVADVERLVNNGSNPTLVATFEVANWFSSKGIEKGHPMNHGGSKKFDFGTVKMVNAVHSSSMPDGSYGGNPVGFVVQSEGKTFYYAGDTALHYDMKLIKEEFDLDLAILPIGDNFTMGITDAVKAAEFVGAKKVIGMHYDTIPFIKIDHENARREFAAKGIELILMEIGKTLEID